MNLLSLAGAIMTASASVVTGSLRMEHPQNKMMDVTYKYQSNEVNSIDDLVIGNIYELSLNGVFSEDEYYEIPRARIISGRLKLDDVQFEDVGYVFNPTLNNEVFINISRFYEYDEILIYFFNENGESENFFRYSGAPASFEYNLIIQLNDYDFSDYSYVGDVLSYTDYNEIVPSSTHRGNLYTTIYDFFYGIFDTSDTNELSMTIMGQNMNLTSWLAHTMTIILLLLGVLWLILVIRWIFRVFSGLVKI